MCFAAFVRPAHQRRPIVAALQRSESVTHLHLLKILTQICFRLAQMAFNTRQGRQCLNTQIFIKHINRKHKFINREFVAQLL